MADNKLTDRKSCDISSLSTNILETILREDLNSKPEDRLTPEEIQYIVSILKKREEEAEKSTGKNWVIMPGIVVFTALLAILFLRKREK